VKLPDAEPIPAIVRAYVPHQSKPGSTGARVEPSQYSLVFDCETTSDTVHSLRFGCFQVYWQDFLQSQGLFYDPSLTSEHDLRVLTAAAGQHSLELLELGDFIDDVFLKVVYDLTGLCVGFNLPFDISRIARGHVVTPSKDGFSFDLSETRPKLRLRIRQRNGRSRIGFVTTRSRQPSDHAGHFIDVTMLGRALTGTHHSLKTLSKTLGTEHQKLDAEHGAELDSSYIGYCVNDVQVTWECFQSLRDLYSSYALTQTPITQVVSEASIGKAALREMGIAPFRAVQSDFPPELLGRIMSTLYGGRSEVRLRFELGEVIYCDFLSMYTTCCANLGLWPYVIAQGMDYHDATAETRAFLDGVTVSDLQDPAILSQLAVIVELAPDADRLPVRADYQGTPAHSDAGVMPPAPGIANCYVSSNEETLIYALPDCVASKLITGRAPTVIRATRFTPRAPQPGLAAINVAGNPGYRVDPYEDDYYRKLIELRNDVKKRREAARASGDHVLADRLDAEQQGMKITASSTSYGALIELNVEELSKRKIADAYGRDGSFLTEIDRVEKAGRYFHPLPATLITSAARLILTIAEQLAYEHELDWALMDTDSIAFTNPHQLPTHEFHARVDRIRAWFQPLNPYRNVGDLLELEDVNYALNPDGSRSDDRRELVCLAVSPKRYGLFNINPLWQPELRKASAHGLGYLEPPYKSHQAPKAIPPPAAPLQELGVERWQHDIWYLAAHAAIHKREPQLDQLPGLNRPAMITSSITTPTVAKWFAAANHGASYTSSLRPFGFLMTPIITALGRPLGRANTPFKLIAPLITDPGSWETSTYTDIHTQTTYSISTTHHGAETAHAKTYRQIIDSYLTHPDARRLDRDGNRCTKHTSGYLTPIHVDAFHIEYTGKEADAHEEAAITAAARPRRYATLHQPYRDPFRRWVLPVLRAIGPTKLVRDTGISSSAIVQILADRSRPHPKNARRLTRAAVRHATRQLVGSDAQIPRHPLARLYSFTERRSSGSPP